MARQLFFGINSVPSKRRRGPMVPKHSAATNGPHINPATQIPRPVVELCSLGVYGRKPRRRHNVHFDSLLPYRSGHRRTFSRCGVVHPTVCCGWLRSGHRCHLCRSEAHLLGHEFWHEPLVAHLVELASAGCNCPAASPVFRFTFRVHRRWHLRDVAREHLVGQTFSMSSRETPNPYVRGQDGSWVN